MADFPMTFNSQEELNEAFKERIARAERAAAEKYSDYDTIKGQNTDLTNQIAQLTEQIKKQTETIDGNKTVVDDLTAKVQAYETASVKTKIALELGLPYQMADRLTGDNEDAIRKDAENMIALIGKNKQVPPLGDPEPVVTSSDPVAAAKAEFDKWFKNSGF